MPDGLDRLKGRERLNLLKFVCSFAWADLEIRSEERRFIKRLVERLDLDPDEAERVEHWLELPPSPDAVDPAHIPHKHREVFLAVLDQVIRADGEIAMEAQEHIALLREMLG